MKKPISIYVHIPFCMSKCSYCSFVSKCATNEQIDEYFKMLHIQILAESGAYSNYNITSIYFGGGTPSFVFSKYIKEVVSTIKCYYNVLRDAEITIECNPCSTTKEKLKEYKNIGINRISFGVQSLNDKCLSAIGRKHNGKMAIDVIKSAKSVGFDNISCDILIGIPYQTEDILLDNIKTLVQLGVTHISTYMLMLEEGTKLYEQVCINQSIAVATDDDCVNMYNQSYILLKNLGYERYEISNFARKGFECKHNVNYWDMGEYIGFGLASHSFVNNIRISGLYSFNEYYQYIKQKYIMRLRPQIVPDCERLTNEQKIEECLMLGLRQTKGVSISKLKSLGYNFNDKQNDIEFLKQNNFIDEKGDYLFVTPKNFGATNQIILKLLP